MPDPTNIDPLSQDYRARHGRLCAAVRMTPAQRRWYVLAAFLGLLWFALVPYQSLVIMSYVLAVFFTLVLGVRLVAMFSSLEDDPALKIMRSELRALHDENLPVYSILVPLFREPEVVASLVEHLNRLDYPVDKLDIQLLLEPEDTETLQALRGESLPCHMRITLSPGGQPQTKPRACNMALMTARGDYLVVYDAEDRPEPDQLRKAVCAYRRVPTNVVCLQCRLSHYNSMQSIFAQWSAMEYLIWYHLLLPGLQWLGAPIPLGGTSNHFRIENLRQLDGWDPFNVTEDCDLGMRIARRGWKTWMLDSITWEESVTRAAAWVRQRSRWVKGYWQTWLVHSREHSLRDFGLWQWSLFFLVVGGSTIMLVLNPLMWLVMLAWFFLGWPIVDIKDPVSMVAMILSFTLMGANAVFLLINMAGCLVCRRPELVASALLSPFEWVLLSAAAWKGFWQFFTRPFHWEKTHHGSARLDDVEYRKRRHWLLKAVGPAASFCSLVLLVGGLIMFCVGRVERQIQDQGPPRAFQFPSRFTDAERAGAEVLCSFEEDVPGWRFSWEREAKGKLTTQSASHGKGCLSVCAAFPGDVALLSAPYADLSGYKGIALDLFVPETAPHDIQVLLYLRDRERLWYQHHSGQRLVPGEWTRVEVDLDAFTRSWHAREHSCPWGVDSSQVIRQFGIRVFSQWPYKGPLFLDNLRGIPFSPEEAENQKAVEFIGWEVATNAVPRYGRFELTFDLSKAYANPFDPHEIDIEGVFTSPSGRESRVPAFAFRDYRRSLRDHEEVLVPVGPLRWKVRFAPDELGDYTFKITLKDNDGMRLESDSGRFACLPSDAPGFIRISPDDPRFLARDNGDFFYPIGHNICWPTDPHHAYTYEFPEPKDEGTFTYDRYLERMHRSGANWGRMWLVPWWVGLEGQKEWAGFHGLGHYNLGNAWRLDYLVDRAEELGIYYTLTMTHKSEYEKSFQFNALSAARGGPLHQPCELFTDPRAWRQFKNRLRYCIARWGYSPNVMAWELWGEVNLVPGYKGREREVADWHRAMAHYIRSRDPWRHLVFTHCHDWNYGYQLWALPEIQCVQGNGYIRPPNTTVDHLANFERYLADVAQYGKPVFVAEYGGRSELGAPSGDYLEAQFHSGLWASFMHPFAGVAAHWWWNVIDGEDLYFHFDSLSKVAVDVDRLKHNFKSVTPLVLPAEKGMRAAAIQSDDRGVIWVYHPGIFAQWKDLPAVEGLTLVVRDIEPGNYHVEYWNTTTGQVVMKEQLAAELRLRLTLPRVHRDLAVKYYRLGNGHPPATTPAQTAGPRPPRKPSSTARD